MSKHKKEKTKIEEKALNKDEALTGEKGGTSIAIALPAEALSPSASEVITKKTEMLWIIGVTLSILGILGIDHSPVFGLFSTTLIQNLFYITTGIVSIVIVIPHLNVARILSVLFFFLGALGLAFPIGSFADSYLHFFLSFVYLYIYYSKEDNSLEQLKVA